MGYFQALSSSMMKEPLMKFNFLNRTSLPVMPTIFYITPDSTRFFLLPDGQTLPPGEFLVRTVDKRELRVNEDALRAFEIPQQQAQGLLREEMKQALKQVWGGLVKEAEKEEPDAPQPQAEQLLRDLLKWPEGEELNQQHLLNGARPLLALLSEMLTVAASADPAAQTQAENRLAELRVKLEGYGFPVGEHKIEDLPAKLAAWREAGPSAAEQEQVSALLGRLKALNEA